MCASVDTEEITEDSSAHPDKQNEDIIVNTIDNPKNKLSI